MNTKPRLAAEPTPPLHGRASAHPEALPRCGVRAAPTQPARSREAICQAPQVIQRGFLPPPALHAVLPLPGRALNHGHFILIKSRRTYVSREAGWKRVQDGRNLTRGREEQGYSSPETDGLQRVGEAAGKGASILLLETAWPRSHLLSSPLAPESSARERPRKLCGARAISAALLPPEGGVLLP